MERMIIEPFEGADEKGKGSGSSGDPFTVQINPSTLSVTKAIERGSKNSPLGKNKLAKFKAYEADSLSFELTLDGTGVFERKGTVKKQLRELEEVAFRSQQEIHQSNFLHISWGKFMFRGYLTSIQTSFTSFDAEGNALRAKVSLAFIGYLPPEKLEQASPDLTHIRFVKEGDTLAGFCHDIYGSSRYVIHAAQYNGLVGFRKLEPGQRLEFPPLINASNG